MAIKNSLLLKLVCLSLSVTSVLANVSRLDRNLFGWTPRQWTSGETLYDFMWAYTIKHFTGVINSVSYLARMFVTDSHNYPTLIFAGKAGAYSSGPQTMDSWQSIVRLPVGPKQ
jgi:hypothetical protein